MQSCQRLHLAFRVALLDIPLAIFANVVPHVTHAQTTTELPPSWNDAVAQLADKVAATVSPSTPIALDVKNISSLDASYTSAVELSLEKQLQHHSFDTTSTGPAAAQSVVQLRLTLSESADSYVWVIQTLGGSEGASRSSPVIVAVPRSQSTDDTAGRPLVFLDKQFVWKQPIKFLDFLLRKKPEGDSELLILEKNEIMIHDLADSGSEISSIARIPLTPAPSRDPLAAFDTQDGSVLIGDLRCFNYLDRRQPLRCTQAAREGESSQLRADVETVVPGDCHGKSISLGTGDGDWTEPDSITAHLFKPGPNSLRIEGAIHFDGPVVSLQPDRDTSSARAVVHNLKSGNYEAYIVTATCSH
jgi:hypothetical protein